MKELKRLFTGFLSSLMVLSFILMPIPQTNRAWADDTTSEDCVEDPDSEERGIYKAGCDLDDAQTQSQMRSIYSSDDQKWTGYFQQAVFGMMSVVFLDNLFLKYLYAKDPKVYGNDCPENTAANYTIRGAQLASLAYIIGEVQANIKYNKLSEDAVALEFAAKDKTYMPSESSPEVLEYREKLAAGEDAGEDPRLVALKENNAQEQAYDALIKILEAQIQAIKTKRNLTIAAEVGLLAVEVAEWVSIAKCKKRCVETYADVEAKIKEISPNAQDADQSFEQVLTYSKDVTEPGGTPQSCTQLSTNFTTVEKQMNMKYNNASQNGEEKASEIDKEDEKKSNWAMKLLGGLAAVFQMNKVEDSEAANTSMYTNQQDQDEQNEISAANQNSQQMQQESSDMSTISSNYTDLVKQCEDDIDQLKQDAEQNYTDAVNKKNEKQSNKDTAQSNKDTAQSNKDTAKGIDDACQAYACIGTGIALKAAETALETAKTNLKTAETELKEAEQHEEDMKSQRDDAVMADTYWDEAKPKIDTYLASLYPVLYSRTSCCGFAGVNTLDAQRLLDSGVENFKEDAKDAGLNKTEKKIAGGQTDEELPLKDFLDEIIDTYSKDKNVGSDAVGGSFVYQGFSEKSVMSKRKDITPFNPLEGKFKKKSKSNSSGSLQLNNNEGYTVEFVVPKIIENKLYDYSLRNFVSWNSENPILIMEQINEISRNIKKTTLAIEKQIEVDLHIPGPVMISETEKFQNFSKNIGIILNKFVPIQSAHAMDASGAGMAIGGMALNMLASELGGPWAEVLNVGSKFLMLKGILNMLGMTELFLKPKSRGLTWGALILLSTAIIAFDTVALEKVEGHLETVKKEKRRYMKSAVSRTSLEGDKVKKGDGTLNLQKVEMSSSRNNSMKIKACAVAKGDAIAPGNCPSIIPKQRVSLPEISSRISNHLTLDHLKGLSLTTDALYGASSGSDYGAEKTMNDSNLATINNTRNALKNLAKSLRAEYENDENEKRKSRGLGKSSLGKTMASFNKSFSSAPSGGTGSFGGVKSSSYKSSTGSKGVTGRSYKKKGTSKGGSSTSSTKKTSAGFDLDFGDDDDDSSSRNLKNRSKKNGKKHSKNMRDYEIGMNDINKRKEIPIWKILSNRYIISYPKLLEEEKILNTKENKKK